MTCGIYEIVNRFNGKRYVGSAVNFASRWRVHKHHLRNGKHHSRSLQRAWDKYSEEVFSFNVIERCGRDELIEREQYHIDSGCQYNCSPTASSSLGIKRNCDTKKRVSEAVVKMWVDPEYRAKQVDSRAKFKPSDDWKAERSRGLSGENSGMFNPEIVTFCHPEHGCISETIWWFGKNYGLNKAHLREMTKHNPIRRSHKGWTCRKAPD